MRRTAKEFKMLKLEMKLKHQVPEHLYIPVSSIRLRLHSKRSEWTDWITQADVDHLPVNLALAEDHDGAASYIAKGPNRPSQSRRWSVYRDEAILRGGGQSASGLDTLKLNEVTDRQGVP